MAESSSMECWACGLLLPGSTDLQNAGIDDVDEVVSGGWGFALLHIEGTWCLYGKMATGIAGPQQSHPQGKQA